MIKKLTSFLDYSVFAEFALILFGAVFIAVVIRTLMMRRETAEEQSRIVLDEGRRKPNEH